MLADRVTGAAGTPLKMRVLNASKVSYPEGWKDYRAAASYREQGHLTAYLFRIATNLLHDRWRREAVHRSWLSRQDPVSEAPPAGGPSLRLDLQAVLNRLPRRSRALLWLLYVEGYDHREAAKILGLAATSVRVIAFRARRKLARWLEQAGFDPAPERLASQDSGVHAEDQETSP